jgi:hypothetical protein
MPTSIATLGSLFFTVRHTRSGVNDINAAFMLTGANFTLRGTVPIAYGSSGGIPFFNAPGYEPGDIVTTRSQLQTRSEFQGDALDFDALLNDQVYASSVSDRIYATFTISSRDLVIPNDTAPVINLTAPFTLSGNVIVSSPRFETSLVGSGYTTLQLRREQMGEGRYVYIPHSLLYTIDPDSEGYYYDILSTAVSFGAGWVVGRFMRRKEGK